MAVIHIVAFLAGTIQSGDEILIENRMSAQFFLPYFARERLVRRRAWNEHDFRAVQRERTRSFGIVAIMADQYSDLAVARREYRITEISRLEIKLFIEDR